MKLHTRILIGLGLGAAAGIAANLLWRDATTLAWIVDYLAQPIGQIFVRMLFMVVVPLVFTPLALGVAGLGDVRRLGRVGFVLPLGATMNMNGTALFEGMTVLFLARPSASS